MSEHVLKVLLSELVLLRITCDTCKSAVEVPLGWVQRSPRPLPCPGCGAHLREPLAGGHSDAIDTLARALEAVLQVPGRQVSFVLPAPEPPAAP